MRIDLVNAVAELTDGELDGLAQSLMNSKRSRELAIDRIEYAIQIHLDAEDWKSWGPPKDGTPRCVDCGCDLTGCFDCPVCWAAS